MQILENKIMKQLLGILLFIPMLLCLSCTEEQLSPEHGDSEIVSLAMNLSAKSGIINSEISTLRIIAFDSFNGTLKYNDLVDLSKGTIQILSGMSDFYAIINEPVSMTTELSNVSLLSDLKTLRILTNEMIQGSSYVMQGNILKQNIKAGVTNNSVTITVRRLAVKINLTVWGISLSKPTEIAFTDLPVSMSLLEAPYEPATTERVTVSGLIDTGNIPTGYLWEQKVNDIVVPSYLFEPTDDKDKAAQIEVKINNKVTRAAIGHAIKADSDPKDYTLHRNTIYSLTAITAGDNLTIENISIENWESKEEQFPAGGGVWTLQPEKQRKAIGEKAIFSAQFTSRTAVSYRWFRKRQTNASSFIVEEITSGITSDPMTKTTTLEITPTGLDEAGLIYCVATTTSSDGAEETIESSAVTFMVVGDWTSTNSEFEIMQNWKTPKNVPLGATCLLRDNRDDKIYRVKLMADGNWWMIQDLGYGNVVSETDFTAHCDDKDYKGLGNGMYGVAVESNTVNKGHLYNVFAAIQIAVNPDDYNPTGTKPTDPYGNQYQFLGGPCPEGWHLPGNMDAEFNKEWRILGEAIRYDLTVPDGIMKFEYNDPTHFNAYTDVTTVIGSGVAFHGGYILGKLILQLPLQYSTLGIWTNNTYGGVTSALFYSFSSDMKIPVRCVKNFR